MTVLTAAGGSYGPDGVALAMTVVFAATVLLLALRKRLSVRKKKKAPAPQKDRVAPGSAGQVKLYGVEPKTAAMLMAIVAYNMGKPLNELRFLSIREVSP